MAAVAPSETLKRQESAADEVVTSGEDGVRSPCRRDEADEAAGQERADSASPGGEAGAEAGDNDISSLSGVESGAGALKTTCNSPEDLTSAQKMAEPLEASEERDFDWSEPEDDAVQTNEEENDKCDETQQKTQPVVEAEETSDTLKDPVEDEVEKPETNQDSSAKPKKCSIFCKECGKYFNQRETYNLHRNFHTCENELTFLTCKECGLTFQQRSSFVKHRNEHKEKEEQAKAEESVFQCAGCDRFFSNVNKLRGHTCDSSAEKPYHCPLCHQQFQFKVSVNKHMLVHSQEDVFKCAECNQTFPDSTSLRIHQRGHGALKPYECPDCGMVFKHYSLMEHHRRKHVDNTRSHLCNICGKSFKYGSLLHQHQYLHTGQKPFRCPECGKKFAFAQNMKAHCRQHRLQRNNLAELPQKPAPVEDGVRGKENTIQREEMKRTFNCPLCPQTYTVPAELRTHMRMHEAEYESMERRQNIPKDSETYWEKGHTCAHCPSTFRDENSLKAHISSAHKQAPYLDTASVFHNQITPLSPDNVQPKWKSEGVVAKSFKCSECEKSFRHRSVLELHMRIHSKDKPYQCKVCGKAFRFGSYLQQHLIIHTGKKPYKCPHCGKDFAFLQNMKTHQKLHQEKPFRCTSCRKGYSDETQLQQHMLSHNGDKPHKCDLCDKSFGLAYLLRDHMNTHTGDRPHRCDECHKSFSWFSSLLVHQKIHARKRQSLGLFSQFQTSTRMRGRGVRGRRGGRHMWGMTRPLGELGLMSSPPTQYSVSAMRDIEMHRRAAQQPQSSLHPDLQVRSQKESWISEPQTVQWKVDCGEQPHVSTQPIMFDSASQSGLQLQIRIPQSNFSSSLPSEKPSKSPPSAINSHPAGLPTKSSPSSVGELEQHRLARTWTTAITSTASVSSLAHDFTVPSPFIDGAALWSIRPALLTNSQSSPNKPAQELLPLWPGSPVSKQKEPSTPKKEDNRMWDVTNPQATSSTVSQAEKPWNGCDPQKQWASGLVSTAAQIDQSSPLPISTSVSHRVGSPLWDLQTPPGISKSITSPEKLINSKDFQLQQKSPGWSQPATQKVSISIPFDPHRFAQGMGSPVWSFQNNSLSPQSLLTGTLKPGTGQELQQQTMVTTAQILINQPPPFFSPTLAPLASLAMPGPHSLHSVALPRAPHPNIFFSPQAVITDRSHLAQTLALPQLAPRNEPHKLGPRLPFPPERLLQCMICGLSLPREMDLQMHYLQHAQGEI